LTRGIHIWPSILFFLLQSLFFLNITSNSSYACSSVVPVMSELAAAPPDGSDATLASARVGWLARAWLTREQAAALAFA
jgi:hypothetical protein